MNPNLLVTQNGDKLVDKRLFLIISPNERKGQTDLNTKQKIKIAQVYKIIKLGKEDNIINQSRSKLGMQYKEFLTAALVCSVTVPHLSQQLRE